MKKFINENRDKVIIFTALTLMLSVCFSGVYWVLTNHTEPHDVVLRRVHQIYCVEDTAFLLFPYAVVIAPPHFTHHGACAAMFAAKQKNK